MWTNYLDLLTLTTWPMSYYFVLLAYAFCFLSILYVASWLCYKLTRSGLRNLKSSGANIRQKANLITVDHRVAFVVLCLALIGGYWKGRIDGYNARDLKAYSQFTERPHVHWKVVKSYDLPNDNKTAFDLQLPSGEIVENFVPCEYAGWRVGEVITGAGYYNQGSCMSFLGPKAYITIQAKGENK